MYFSLEIRADAAILRFPFGVDEAVQLCMISFLYLGAKTSSFCCFWISLSTSDFQIRWVSSNWSYKVWVS